MKQELELTLKLTTESDPVTVLRELLTEAIVLFRKPPKGMGGGLVVPDFIDRVQRVLKDMRRNEAIVAKSGMSEIEQLKHQVMYLEQRCERYQVEANRLPDRLPQVRSESGSLLAELARRAIRNRGALQRAHPQRLRHLGALGAARHVSALPQTLGGGHWLIPAPTQSTMVPSKKASRAQNSLVRNANTSAPSCARSGTAPAAATPTTSTPAALASTTGGWMGSMRKVLKLCAVHCASWGALKLLAKCTQVVHSATGDACYYGGDTQSEGFFYLHVPGEPNRDIVSPLGRARELLRGRKAT